MIVSMNVHAFSRATILLTVVIAGFGADYYVDASAGQDSNPGTSSSAPWKSLEKLNTTTFAAGDRVLFKSGETWRGQLIPKSSGETGRPVVFTRYGSGPRPKIDGGGEIEDVVRIYNLHDLELRDLELTNHGTTPAIRRGVHIFLDNYGTAKHVVVGGLYIHDVNGVNGVGHSNKDNGGIIFRTNGDKKPTRFDGLTIERNVVQNVDRSGIAAQSNHFLRSRWFPSLHVIIRDNYVDDVGGDGIVPWATDGVLVEHNIARNCNRRAGSYNAGIWPWSTDNSLFQLNEASFTRTTRDGEGFDSDFNSRNTLFQYNYSHDNEGGFMLICTPGKRDEQENVGNRGTVVRYNISRNDHTRGFNLSAAENTLVHDNVLYVGPGIDMQMLAVTDWDGWATGAVFRRNTFWVAGTARYGHEVSRKDDGTYGIAPGWGPAKGIVFDSNRYIGTNIDRPPDEKAVVEASAPPPDLDWNEPQFESADPDRFASFMSAHRRWMLRLFKQQFGKPVKLGR
jgi:Right handed beta helix region